MLGINFSLYHSSVIFSEKTPLLVQKVKEDTNTFSTLITTVELGYL